MGYMITNYCLAHHIVFYWHSCYDHIKYLIIDADSLCMYWLEAVEFKLFKLFYFIVSSIQLMLVDRIMVPCLLLCWRGMWLGSSSKNHFGFFGLVVLEVSASDFSSYISRSVGACQGDRVCQKQTRLSDFILEALSFRTGFHQNI